MELCVYHEARGSGLVSWEVQYQGQICVEGPRSPSSKCCPGMRQLSCDEVGSLCGRLRAQEGHASELGSLAWVGTICAAPASGVWSPAPQHLCPAGDGCDIDKPLEP